MATLLDILGLAGGSPADAILGAITGGGAGATQAPATTTPPPAAAPAPPPDPLAALAAIVGRGRAQGVADALKSVGQSQDNRTPGAASAARKFGGQVLGFGQRSAVGHMGDYAVVLRDGKLWHVGGGKPPQKLDDGAVARALGIKPKLGAVEVVHGHGHRGNGNGTGGTRAPDGGGGNGTGGAMAPTTLSDSHRAPVDPLTGGVVAPTDNGVAQASSPEVSPPVTGATVGTQGPPAVPGIPAGMSVQQYLALKARGLLP